MRKLCIIWSLLTGTTCLAQSSLTVVIEHAQPPVPGTLVSVVLAERPDCFLDGHGCRVTKGESSSTMTRVEIDSLPPGRYGLMAFIDENDNGRLDKGWNNTPTEPNGFGNNATGRTGLPAFEDTIIEVHEGRNVHRIRMH